MIRAPLSTTSVLDEATDVVALTASPWAAVLVATAIPYRLMLALFVDRLFEIGSRANEYGHFLGTTANLTIAAFVLAIFGRSVYARACRLALARGTSPGREAWRVPRVALASHLLTASLAAVMTWLTLFTLIGPAVATVISGLGAGTMELNERAAVRGAFKLVFRYAKQTAIPIALSLIFVVAFAVSFVNVASALSLITWLVTAIGGFDAPHWNLLFSGENRRYILLLLAGATVVLEPFWVAAFVVLVRKAGAEENGDDLRVWFDEVRRSEA
ncbi:MAG TPA: hypothetical protein VFN10_24045 [Thermoanaerobaculia bacterium]|nr:hypothetical protein [Thermoanaerobaculia bacterium]